MDVKTWIHFFATVAVVSAASATELARWNAKGVENPLAGSFAPTASADGMTVSNLMAGSGLQLSGNAVPSSSTFSAVGYDQTSAAAAMSSNDWWETCLDAGTNVLLLESLQFAFRSPKSGPKNAQWAWSTNWSEWHFLGTEESIDDKWVERTPVDLGEIPDASRIWLRMMAWNGGAGTVAWGGFGKDDVLKIYGEVLPVVEEPMVGFSPSSPWMYVGEPLTLTVRARPMRANVMSITVNPMPVGSVTPNLTAGTWTFVPDNADFDKTFTVTAEVSNAYWKATGSVDVHVNGTVAEENGVTWCFYLLENNAIVTGASPMEGELSIPSSLGGYAVTRIGERAFINSRGLTSVTIPDSVTSIGREAFSYCSGLTSVTLGTGVTNIENYAFNMCSNVTSVTVLQSVCGQGLQWVFPDSYRRITNIVIGTTVTSIGDDVFSGFSGLTSVTIPNSVTSIGWNAFEYCRGLTNVTIPDSVTNIGGWAFASCSGLTSLTIPNSVTDIGDHAFYQCTGLTSVTIPQVVCDCSLANVFSSSYQRITNVTIEATVTNIGGRAFAECSELTSVTIPDGVTTIGDEAFLGCGLASLTMPDSVTDIGYRAFEGSSLTNVVLGEGVKSISDYAFFYCSGLTSVTIPESVVSIGESAFTGCGLTNLTILDGVPSIGGGAFSGCSDLTSVTIPGSVVSIGGSAFTGCGLTNLTILDGVTSIGCNAFAYCRGLTSVTIPDSVTNIGDQAFYDCRGLRYVKIGERVTEIGYEAFSGCYGLRGVSIPDSVSNVPYCAFSACPNLKWASVPVAWSPYHDNSPLIAAGGIMGLESECLVLYGYRPETIDGVEWAWFFRGWDDYACSVVVGAIPSEGELSIPETLGGCSVGIISDEAFSECTNLTSVTIPGSVMFIKRNAFRGCAGLTDMTLGEGVTDIGSSAFSGCTKLTNVVIPASVTNIGDGAFSYCLQLEAIEVMHGNAEYESEEGVLFTKDKSKLVQFPGGKGGEYAIADCVTNIGSSAFSGCAKLTSVAIPASVTSIKDGTFFKCIGLTAVSIPGSVTHIGWSAFSGCSGLTDVRIPEGVTSIGSRAFEECAGLTRLTIPDGVTSIEYGTFSKCIGLTAVSIPGSVTKIGWDAFSGCKGLTDVRMPEGVTSIEGRAFEFCNALENMTIPDSVTNVGSDAFWGSGLQMLSVPGSWEGTAMLANAGIPKGCEVVYREGGLQEQAIEWKEIGPAMAGESVELRATATSGGEVIFEVVSGPGEIVGNMLSFTGVGTVVVKAIQAGDEEWAATEISRTIAVCPASGVLTLELATAEVGEGEGGVRCVIMRSGPTGLALEVGVTSSRPGIVSVPETVTIAAGALSESFLATPVDNALVDGTREVVLGVMADGYEGAEATLRVLDDEEPGSGGDLLPDVSNDAEVAEVLAEAADARLAERISSVADYNAFREWVEEKNIDSAAVVESEHSWASYALGAEELFENEPVVMLGMPTASEGVESAKRDASGAKWEVSVTVKDGEKVAAVDAEKVAVLFECTGDLTDWAGAAVKVSVEPQEGEGEAMRFRMTPEEGTSRAFLRIGE